MWQKPLKPQFLHRLKKSTMHIQLLQLKERKMKADEGKKSTMHIQLMQLKERELKADEGKMFFCIILQT